MSFFSDVLSSVSNGFSGLLETGLNVFENRRAADKERDFRSDMYRTRYQMTVNDMRKAGLNPALAYAQGGAAAPVGSGSNVVGLPKPDFGNNARARERLDKEVDVLEAQAGLLREQKQKTEVDKEVANIEGLLKGLNIDIGNEQLKNIRTTRAKTEEEIESIIESRRVTTNTARRGDLEMQRWENLNAAEKSEIGRIMAFVDRLFGPGVAGDVLEALLRRPRGK